jgi:hypothetical protein
MAATKTYAPRSRCLARSSILNHRLRKPRRLRRRPMNPDLRLNPRGLRNLRFNLIPNRTPQGLPRGAQEKSSQDARIRMVSKTAQPMAAIKIADAAARPIQSLRPSASCNGSGRHATSACICIANPQYPPVLRRFAATRAPPHRKSPPSQDRAISSNFDSHGGRAEDRGEHGASHRIGVWVSSMTICQWIAGGSLQRDSSGKPLRVPRGPPHVLRANQN